MIAQATKENATPIATRSVVSADVVECREFVLRDDQGRVRAKISVDSDDFVRFKLNDRNGLGLATVNVAGDGRAAFIYVADPSFGLKAQLLADTRSKPTARVEATSMVKNGYDHEVRLQVEGGKPAMILVGDDENGDVVPTNRMTADMDAADESPAMPRSLPSPAQLLALKDLKEELRLSTKEWLFIMAYYQVPTARDLSEEQVCSLLNELRRIQIAGRECKAEESAVACQCQTDVAKRKPSRSRPASQAAKAK